MIHVALVVRLPLVRLYAICRCRLSLEHFFVCYSAPRSSGVIDEDENARYSVLV